METIAKNIWDRHKTLGLLIVMLKVRVLPGSSQRTYPEPHQIGVEQFLEMLRFDQRPKLEELRKIRMRIRDDFY
jgi:hypothetical protein